MAGGDCATRRGGGRLCRTEKGMAPPRAAGRGVVGVRLCGAREGVSASQKGGATDRVRGRAGEEDINICVAWGALLSYAPDNAFAPSFPHSRLPMDAFAAPFLARRAWLGVPVSSDVLEIFSRGGGTSRGAPRELAWGETAGALPSMGRTGGGSGARNRNAPRSTLNVQRSMNWQLAAGNWQLVVCE